MSERAEADKFSHRDVGYEHPARRNNAFCAICRHFIKARPPRCEIVKEPIRGTDWCEKFERA